MVNMNIEKILNLVENEVKETFAYPNNTFQNIEAAYDTKKWIKAMSSIKNMENKGVSKFDAVYSSTKGWEKVELDNFLKWMKYYESGDYLKYKYASLWYHGDSPGYFLNIKDNNSAADFSLKVKEEQEEKEEKIEKQRKKILSRIESLEKQLSTKEAKELAGPEFDNLIEVIYDLKKKIRKLEKVADSNKIYSDLFVRKASKCLSENKQFSYELLTKFAQTLAPAPPPAPIEPVGNPGNLPGEAPGQVDSGNEPPSNPTPSSNISGVKGFINKIKGNDTKDVGKDELYVYDGELLSVAQIVPPEATPQQNELNITEKDLKPATPTTETSNKITVHDFDHQIDNLFKNVTIEDVVAKLDELSQIFKRREIPRQLSIVDMMLDSLNLSSYFTSLSEASNRALESNNYISVRIDEILSKLRGAMKTKEIDLLGTQEDQSKDPVVDNVKKNLKNEEEAEKRKKEMRKEIENQALLSEKKEPEIEIKEEVPPVVTEPKTEEKQVVPPPTSPAVK